MFKAGEANNMKGQYNAVLCPFNLGLNSCL